MPDKVKSFGEVDSGKDPPRAKTGNSKPIRNGQKKIKNFNQFRPSRRAETSFAGKENEIRLQKKRVDG